VTTITCHNRQGADAEGLGSQQSSRKLGITDLQKCEKTPLFFLCLFSFGKNLAIFVKIDFFHM
jgi:hypothetical protein